MEEIYIKILNGELNIKYLSPNDLINLESYLQNKHDDLEQLLQDVKSKNSENFETISNMEKEIEEIFSE